MRITFRCVTWCASNNSCLKRARIAGFEASSGRMTFNATNRSSSRSAALYTAPMPPSPRSCRISYRPPSRSPISNTAALADALEIRLDGGAGVRRNEVPGAILTLASTRVASGSNCCPASRCMVSTMVASGSCRDGPASTSVASSWGATGTLLPERSPANGVLTPASAGFLKTDFSSGRNLESSMLRFNDGPDVDETIPHRIHPSARLRVLRSARSIYDFRQWQTYARQSVLSSVSTNGLDSYGPKSYLVSPHHERFE